VAYQVWFRAMPVAVDRAARRGDVRRHRFRSRHGPGNDRLLILAPRINPCRRSSRRKSRRRKASGGSLTAHGSIDERSPSPVPSAASPGRSADRRTSSSTGSTSAPSHPTCGTPNLRHTQLAAHLRNLLSPRHLDLGFTQLSDDPLRCKLRSSWHRLSSFACDHKPILAPVVVSFEGGRSACVAGRFFGPPPS